MQGAVHFGGPLFSDLDDSPGEVSRLATVIHPLGPDSVSVKKEPSSRGIYSLRWRCHQRQSEHVSDRLAVAY